MVRPRIPPTWEWDTLAMMENGVREVVSSSADRGTIIVGRVFSPTRQQVRFSHLNLPFIQNYELIKIL